MNPTEDGITHINIYSKGRTELGRSLSNFAPIGFVHNEFGEFASMEAFWYYVSTGLCHDELRDLSGFAAKEAGKKYQKIPVREELFREAILSGIRCKLRQNPDLLKKLTESDLPLAHYYVYGDKVVLQEKYDWMTDEITRIRNLMKKQ